MSSTSELFNLLLKLSRDLPFPLLGHTVKGCAPWVPSLKVKMQFWCCRTLNLLDCRFKNWCTDMFVALYMAELSLLEYHWSVMHVCKNYFTLSFQILKMSWHVDWEIMHKHVCWFLSCTVDLVAFHFSVMYYLVEFSC